MHIHETVHHPSLGNTDVRLFHGAWNFQEFFSPLNTNFSGLTAAAGAKDVVHSWRFCRREDLWRYVGRDGVEMLDVPQAVWGGCARELVE